MKKSILVSILFSLVSMTESYGMHTLMTAPLRTTLPLLRHQARFFSPVNSIKEPDNSFEYKGVLIKRDRFGNLHPQWQTLQQDHSTQLEDMVDVLSDQYPGKAFIVTLPVEQFHLASGLSDAGFTLHHAQVNGSSSDRAEFIYKNGSPIPAPATAIAGSKIFLRNNRGEVLFVHDRNPHLANMLMIPGGGVDVQEFIEQACVRELREETGLMVKPEHLNVIAIGNRVKVNPQGMSDTCWYFTADRFEGDLAAQQSEIKELLWAPLDDVLFHGKYRDLTPTLTTIEILKHLYKGATKPEKIKIPDLRQQLKPEKQRDPNDTMDLFLFGLSNHSMPVWKE